MGVWRLKDVEKRIMNFCKIEAFNMQALFHGVPCHKSEMAGTLFVCFLSVEGNV